MPRVRSAATMGLLLLTACPGDDPAAPDPGYSRPAFVITSPARGEMRLEGTLDTSSVTVSGQVCDPDAPIVELTLNGTVLPVSGTNPCESFSVAVATRWGLTILTGVARNAQGRTTRLARSFLRGPAYFPAADTADVAARVPHGISAHLTQAVLDSRVADIVWQYTTRLNWNDVFPVGLGWANFPWTPIIYNCGGIFVPGYTTGWWMRRNTDRTYEVHGPWLSVRASARPGNFVDFVARTDLNVPLQIDALLSYGCAGGWDGTGILNGWAGTHALDLVWGVGLEIQHLGGGLNAVRSSGASTSINDNGSQYFGFSFAPGFPVDSMRWYADTMIHLMVGFSLDYVLQQQVVPALEQLLSGLVPLPPGAAASPGLLPANVSVPDSLSSGTGLISVTSAVQLRPATPRPGPSASRGALRRDGTEPGPATLQGSEFGTAVKDDLINQYFWAAWRGGAFDGGLAAVPCQNVVPGVSLSSYALLPPVLMPDSGNRVAIGLGDLRVSGIVEAATVGLTGTLIGVELYASSILTGTLGLGAAGVGGDALTITYDPAAELHLEITAISDSAALDSMPAVLTPYVDCLTKALTRYAIESVPLPGFLPPNVPGMSTTPWRPGNPILERLGNYTVLRGTAP